MVQVCLYIIDMVQLQMKIYKRYVDLMGNVEVIKAITNIQLKPDTYVEVLIKDDDYKK